MKQPMSAAASIERACCAVLIFVTVFASCSQKDDAQLVRDIIGKCARLAEQKQIGGLLDFVSEDFQAQPGRYDTRSVKGVLFATFQRYGRFEIHYPRPVVKISPDGNEAEAAVFFLIVVQDRSIPGLKELYEDPQGWLEAVGEKADLYQLELHWVKANGKWLVRRAYLERFGRRRHIGFVSNFNISLPLEEEMSGTINPSPPQGERLGEGVVFRKIHPCMSRRKNGYSWKKRWRNL